MIIMKKIKIIGFFIMMCLSFLSHFMYEWCDNFLFSIFFPVNESIWEHMKLLMLNSKAKLLGETNISKGTVNASLITPRELFIEALQKNAVSIIILHNHPSGDPTPSREDMLTTKRILDAGALIGIDLLDHIIIGNNCYMSFREEGML